MQLKALWDKFILRDLWLVVGPWYILIKIFIALLLTIVIDKYVTQQPDSISSTFNALLFLSPVTISGLSTGLVTLAAGLMGTTMGTIFNLIFGGTADPTFRVPLACSITYYMLCLIRQQSNPVANTSAFFSTLFVQLVLFEFPPASGSIPYTLPWGQPVHTFIVRVVALVTALATTLLTNFCISGLFYPRIFSKRLRELTSTMPHTLQKLATSGDPVVLTSTLGTLQEISGSLAAAKREISFYRRPSSSHFAILEQIRLVVDSYAKITSLCSFIGQQSEILDKLGFEYQQEKHAVQASIERATDVLLRLQLKPNVQTTNACGARCDSLMTDVISIEPSYLPQAENSKAVTNTLNIQSATTQEKSRSSNDTQVQMTSPSGHIVSISPDTILTLPPTPIVTPYHSALLVPIRGLQREIIELAGHIAVLQGLLYPHISRPWTNNWSRSRSSSPLKVDPLRETHEMLVRRPSDNDLASTEGETVCSN